MSGSTIYNHRSLQPTGPPTGQGSSAPPATHARLNDSFEAIRHEFEAVNTDLTVLRAQRDDLEAKVANQVNELSKIHSALYDLEAQHKQVRNQYEDEVHRLRGELHAARQGLNPHPPIVGPGSHGPGSVGPASIGLPPGPPPPGPSSNAPPGIPPQGYSDPYYRERDRERERDKERERELRDRERERDRIEREREAEARDRDRDRERALDRDRDRSRNDTRSAAGSIDAADYNKRTLGPPPDRGDAKRYKQDRIKSDRSDQYSPSLGPGLTPKLPPLPSTSGASSGPVGAPGGPGIPPPPGQTHAPYPPSGPAAPPEPPAPAAPPSHSSALVPLGPGGAPPGAAVTGPGAPGGPSQPVAFPDDLDIHSIPADLKKEGSDWFAIFNPNTKRTMDVQLVHTLMHESVVCCVRFSQDGKYLATGCNRTAQIYDTKTGIKTSVLVDEQAAKSGDLYIRSVCFSPDGKYLATGAEDKQIRIWDIAKKRIRIIFDGHQQEIYSLDFSADGRLIVSGSGDKTARIWDMEDGTSKVLTINDPDSLNNDAGVTSVAISPDGKYVAAGSLDTVVRIWDVATAQLVERLRGHRDSVYSVAFTPDGKGLVSGSLDKTLKYWDVSALMSGKSRKEANGTSGPGQGAIVKTGDKASQCTMNFTGHKDYVLSVAVSHDGEWVVSGSKDRGVQFWDSRNAIVQCMLQGHKNSVISIDLSKSGSMLATGSGDWQARIWSYNNL